MFLSSLSKYADAGLLIVRIVLGVMFVFYGQPKLFGGYTAWSEIGQAMQGFHISFAPAFWGFMAGLAMFAGGVCLVLGFLFRPACILLAFVMIVATRMHFAKGDGLFGAAHAMEDGAMFLALLFVGPGRYSVDAWLKSIRNFV